MLSTDKQTDKQTNQRYQKHNLLCQGGKYQYHNTNYTLHTAKSTQRTVFQQFFIIL